MEFILDNYLGGPSAIIRVLSRGRKKCPSQRCEMKAEVEGCSLQLRLAGSR